jgi:hypothetical protein
MIKNEKKLSAEKKNYYIFLSKTTIYLSLGLHKVFPCYRRNLRHSKENIKHFKALWVIFALLDPDPLT